jgi:ribosomal-protein-alanine N-acetyltransferase
MKVTIRAGTLSDIPAMVALAQQYASAAHWNAVQYRNAFASGRMFLVASDGTEVAGVAVVHPIGDQWELENIAVVPEWARQGIATSLISKLIRGALEAGVTDIFLEVRESNISARKLYEKCGFTAAGRRSLYYDRPAEDALLYRFLCNPKLLEKD